MCRTAAEPGGPRRCSKHMGERLAAARATYMEHSAEVTEKRAVLAARHQRYQQERAEGFPGATENTLRGQVRKAEDNLRTAQRRMKASATTLAHARAGYDSTREGLHELRQAHDARPEDAEVNQRLLDALDSYEAEAAQREVRFGPQGPLSEVGMNSHQQIPAGLTGWLKSAPKADARSGLYDHRVNLVWRQEDGRRRSVTVSVPSGDPYERPAGQSEITGQPTLAEVVGRMRQSREVMARFGGIYERWRESARVPNSVVIRHQWRAMEKSARAFDVLVQEE